MPRRSGGGGGMRRPSAPMRSAPPPQRSSIPARAPAPAHAAAPAQSQGPGLMGQMAATAGGVAIGSAVGHSVANMFSGGGGGGSEAPAPQQPLEQPQQGYNQQRPLAQPCEFEMKQFLECTQNQDLSLCEGFNQALKECRVRFGV